MHFLAAFLCESLSPSRSVTTISGTIMFSINACVAPSAAIFVARYFFKYGIDDNREGPAPTTKTVFLLINAFNFFVEVFFKIVFNLLADAISLFLSYFFIFL